MGCWALPTTKKKQAIVKASIKKIQKLRDALWGVYGDDILMDGLDMAEERLKEIDKFYSEKANKSDAA